MRIKAYAPIFALCFSLFGLGLVAVMQGQQTQGGMGAFLESWLLNSCEIRRRGPARGEAPLLRRCSRAAAAGCAGKRARARTPGWLPTEPGCQMAGSQGCPGRRVCCTQPGRFAGGPRPDPGPVCLGPNRLLRLALPRQSFAGPGFDRDRRRPASRLSIRLRSGVSAGRVRQRRFASLDSTDRGRRAVELRACSTITSELLIRKSCECSPIA